MVKRAKNDDNTIAEWAGFLSTALFNTRNISICPVLTHFGGFLANCGKSEPLYISWRDH